MSNNNSDTDVNIISSLERDIRNINLNGNSNRIRSINGKHYTESLFYNELQKIMTDQINQKSNKQN